MLAIEVDNIDLGSTVTLDMPERSKGTAGLVVGIYTGVGSNPTI